MTTYSPAAFHPLYQERLHLLDGVPAPSVDDTPESLARRHAFDAPFADPDLPVVDTEEREVPGPNGPVRVRLYRRVGSTSQPSPALVWIHGGAFMHGDIDVPEADHFARVMANRTDTVVISVAYRLCDEHTHLPVPHDDCYAVYTWVRQHSAELDVDPSRLAVGGGSAGANLAASVALHAGETGQKPWQMLLAYPVVHPTLPPASPELRAALAMTPDAIRYRADAGDRINEFVMGRPLSGATPYDFPALASDVTKFPPAYIENSEFDELRASGEAFAAQLEAAGVDVEMVTAPGVPHGHLNAVGSPMLEDAYGRFARRLERGSLHA
ncbi:MAG TPA: alpha/beta hydrolase [Propionibacteriaceae bacterium]|nr:alpha/beta hydrolase [Propionibacteriaceae bacterium]